MLDSTRARSTSAPSPTDDTPPRTRRSSTSAPTPTTPPLTSSRRPSWLTNISSKFSSSSNSSTPAPSAVTTEEPPLPSSTPSTPTQPPSPSHQPPGFLISTLRRLSTANRTKSQPAHTPPQCPRRVLNRDVGRERCCVEGLEGAWLRKVAFSVDVEVAPTSEDIEARREARRKRKEAKEAKAKAEREAAEKAGELTPPDAEVKTEEGKDGASLEQVPTQQSAETGLEQVPTKGSVESEKNEEKETKEKKRRRVHTRPTTDPARIYGQCCQLRETQPVPRVKECFQKLADLGAPGGLIDTIDLTGLHFEHADAVAFSDFLALVPVRCLVLEDCNLTDGMVRVVLSALTAVRAPNATPIRPASVIQADGKTPSPHRHGAHEKAHYLRGAIERLSLKNNPKIAADGWKYIATFIHMSRTLKSIDVSGVCLPQPMPMNHQGILGRSGPMQKDGNTQAKLLGKVLGQRLVGHGLEELLMANCELSAEYLKTILEGVIKGGTRRLGLGSNNLNDDGLAAVGQWMKSSDNGGVGCCESLDMSGNDLQDHMDIISASLNEISPLCALTLSNCNLTPDSLKSLLPALSTAPHLRWLNLSDNPSLFSTQPDALPLLRHYLPRIPTLRKIDLSNTSMTPDHAIALAEILPDCPQLAFFRLCNNPILQSPSNQGSVEEGAALFTALIAAVKVSKTIIRVDIDEPDSAAGEVMRNLSQRLLAQCIQNMETSPAVLDDWSVETPATPHPDGNTPPLDDLEVPPTYEYDANGVWRDEESYLVGGTGVVKALGVCLGHKPGSGIPLDEHLCPNDTEKANELSKALLRRARRIKARIQPALRRPYSGQTEEFHHRRLQFLDSTLTSIISRFELEYPETRTTAPLPIPGADSMASSVEFIDTSSPSTHPLAPPSTPPASLITTELKPISRRSSDVSMHSRYLEKEEGQMHKLAHYVKSQVPEGKGREELLRRVEEYGGEELRMRVLGEEGGVEKVIERLESEMRKRAEEGKDDDDDAIEVDEEDVGPMGERR